jgi:hypothetical protein
MFVITDGADTCHAQKSRDISVENEPMNDLSVIVWQKIFLAGRFPH